MDSLYQLQNLLFVPVFHLLHNQLGGGPKVLLCCHFELILFLGQAYQTFLAETIENVLESLNQLLGLGATLELFCEIAQ